MNKDKPLTIL